MAGGHGALKRENVYMHFKFTPAVTRKILFWAGVVPLATYYMASNQDYKWDWAGKTKTESTYRVAPASSTPAAEEES
ncbi:hypothetical protein FRB90_002681 [Tulasnella sp. 427]|nr:hypothetical protein FRB90_002681 [Tulasnella sp. 427]